MSIQRQELSVIQRPRNPMRFLMFLRQWVKYRGRVDGLLIREGSVIPRGFGVAYRLVDRDVAVVLPVPLNWIVGWMRRGWQRLVYGPEASMIVRARRAERHAFEQGERAHDLWQQARASYDCGFEAGRSATVQEIQDRFDEWERLQHAKVSPPC